MGSYLTKLRALTIVSFLCVITACGGGGGDRTQQPVIDRNVAGTSTLCPEVLTGLEGVFWDFMNGVIRADLPATAFTIPFAVDFSQPYVNSVSPLLNFSVPLGWTATNTGDVSGFAFPVTVAAADLRRNDGAALWRYTLNGALNSAFAYSAQAILEAEINYALNMMGNPGQPLGECPINAQQLGPLGFESVAARVIRAGDVTIMARVHVLEIGGGITPFYDGFLVASRTAEHPTLINDIYVPMITQLYPGGSDDDPACSDGRDNDGDGQVDFPNDLQCGNASDDDESQ